MQQVRIGICGAGFVADIHMESFHHVPGAEVTMVYTRDAARAKAFAEKYGIPRWTDNWEELVSSPEVDVVDVALPNFLHAPVSIAAARHRKHVIVEKPLCMTLEEADAMIAAARDNGVKLMYAEELCFAPKYERVRKLHQEGAFGRIYHLKQAEKHFGPHSPWFWDVSQSGGGVLMDMGCHAIGWFRWFLGGNPRVKSVYCQANTMVHGDRTVGDDFTVTVIEFETPDGPVVCTAEDSWARRGGMDDRIEVYGDDGLSWADLFHGNAALTYSEQGYGYALEKASTTKGWTFTVFEEVFNQGYPHEMRHFIDCVRYDREPMVTGEDGRAALEIIYAAYASARLGRKVELPFRPKVEKPIDLWLKGE